MIVRDIHITRENLAYVSDIEYVNRNQAVRIGTTFRAFIVMFYDVPNLNVFVVQMKRWLREKHIKRMELSPFESPPKDNIETDGYYVRQGLDDMKNK